MSVHPNAQRFADPVLDSQVVFRAVMTALAQPGTTLCFPTPSDAPAPLTPAVAAIILALCDHETSVWLEPRLAGVAEIQAYLRFRTGCELTDEPAAAAFAVILSAESMPPLEAFAQGSDLYPDRSTTVVAGVRSLTDGEPLTLSGPGIRDRASLTVAPRPLDFVQQSARNRAQFPRGVDCLFTAGDSVVGLPRTTVVSEG